MGLTTRKSFHSLKKVSVGHCGTEFLPFGLNCHAQGSLIRRFGLLIVYSVARFLRGGTVDPFFPELSSGSSDVS